MRRPGGGGGGATRLQEQLRQVSQNQEEDSSSEKRSGHLSSPSLKPKAHGMLVALAKYPTEGRAQGHRGPHASKTQMKKSTLPTLDPTPAAQGADPRP